MFSLCSELGSLSFLLFFSNWKNSILFYPRFILKLRIVENAGFKIVTSLEQNKKAIYVTLF